MHKSGSTGPNVDTKWYYLGPDKEKYGPYLSKDMNFWLTAGYFTPDLQLKTENENSYHTLGEWSQVLGSPPFLTPVHSLEASAAAVQWQHARPQPPPQMMVMPPGLNNPFPPQMRMQYPPFVQMPFLQMNQQNGPPQMHSQPPSEPIDGSLSHTPDSENDVARLAEQNLQQSPPNWFVALGLANHGHGHGHGPKSHHSQFHGIQQITKQMQHANVATEQIVMKNADCQTEPPKFEISKVTASRLLTELMGQTVVIN